MGIVAIYFSWFGVSMFQVLHWLYWLQTKEYRFDRFKVLLVSQAGLKTLGLDLTLLKVSLVILFYITDTGPLLFIASAAIVILTITLVKGKVRKPIFTLRIKEIMGTVILVTLSVAYFTLNTKFTWASLGLTFLAGELIIPFSLILGVVWTTPLVIRSRNLMIKKAEEHLSKVRPKVIGITGSFGKSTTKEFVYTLLNQKYKTEKTDANFNTEVGVAKKAAELAPNTEIFVVEMGAYKRGEIKKITDIVKPEIGIITGIEPQHLALFGSLENIKKAKFELIESLPKGSIAIFNEQSPGCVELANLAKKLGYKMLRYGRNFEILNQTPKGINFEITVNAESRKLFTPLTSVHLIENLSAAILIARHMKVSWKDIEKIVKTLKPGKKTLEVYKTNFGTKIIDDSYNSSPASFTSALALLNTFKEKNKIVITPGIIELGPKSSETHRKIGKLISNVASDLFLTNNEFAKDFKIGLGSRENICSVFKNPDELINEVKNLANDKTVILLEGRMPTKFTQFIDELAEIK